MIKHDVTIFWRALCASLALSLGWFSYGAETDTDLSAKIDNYLQDCVSNGFVGSVLVARNGDVILSKGYGLADKKNGIRATSSTVFNIGSITKQFTAAAILKLVEQGKLHISDPISKYLKNVPPDKKDITVHQLLTHTAGISPYTGGFRYDYASRERFLTEFFEAELTEKPGTVHIYANVGYIVLAALIETISKQSYEEFLREQIFIPAGMINTGYKIPEWKDSQLAHSYFFSLADTEWLDWGTTPERWANSDVSWYGIGKGDILSTVEDLYKWHLALQSNIVLSAETREIFETPYVAENRQETSYYAYGWAIFKSARNTKIVSHDGSNGLYFGDFLRFVDDDVVVIYLSSVAPNSYRTSAAIRSIESGNNIEGGAKEIAKLIFYPSYQPEVLPRPNSYELVLNFVASNSPSELGKLNEFMKEKQGSPIQDGSLLNRIGLHFMRNEELNWAIAILTTNIQLFPNDGNLWDTLGEAYMHSGNAELAIKSFEKALAVAPATDCYWCENSEKMLTELGTSAL